MSKKETKETSRVIALNRKAYHDYEILEKYETGIALSGTEVKACRAHQVNLQDNYASVDKGEVWVFKMHISPYSHGNRQNHDPVQPRKLLLHKREIRKLVGRIQQQGLTLVVLRMYWKANWIKVELGLARGKKLHDKRESIAKRDVQRQIERAIRRDG
jgi:SsrA-binding protein